LNILSNRWSYTYNTYTTSSSIWPGDDSYGKTAAIDINTFKVAWVKNIPSQSLNFYDKTSISLKYLVDASNNLTELSRGNFNLQEVQRIFQSGDPVVLSISDVKVPSNQTTLDGTKLIWKGGYSYNPLLYRENNETLNFTHPTPISSSQANLGLKAISDVGISYQSLLSPTNLFVKAPPSDIPSSTTYAYKKNSISQIEEMALERYESSNYKYANSTNPLINFNTGSVIPSNIRIVQNSNNTPFNTGSIQTYYFNILNCNNTGSNVGGYNYEPNPSSTYYIGDDGDYYYKAPRDSSYNIDGSISFSFRGSVYNPTDGYINPQNTSQRLFKAVAFKPVGILEKCLATRNPNQENNWSFVGVTTLQRNFTSVGNHGDNSNSNIVYIWNKMNAYVSYYCNLTATNILLNAGDLIRFRLYIIDVSNTFGYSQTPSLADAYLPPITRFSFIINNSNLNPSQVNNSYFQVKDLNAPTTIYTYNSSYGQIPQLFTTSSANTLLFNSSSLYLFNTASIYNPQAPTSQYYTPVTDDFGIQKYDLIRIGGFESPASTYYEVLNVSSSTNGVYVTLNSNIDTGSFVSNIAQNFAIFRPKQDETSVIIDYKKQPGEVSQTILIPYNASNTIKAAVGNIFKTLNPDLQ